MNITPSFIATRERLSKTYNIDDMVDSILKRRPASIAASVIHGIVTAELNTAADDYENAGYNGSSGDGGAAARIKALASFLDGIYFLITGETRKYKAILDQIAKEADPEYQTYLQLKEKFEK